MSLIKISLSMLALCLVSAQAARFDIVNQCSYTVWPAATPSGGGRQLNSGQTWSIDIPAGTSSGRVWGRTGCSFDGSGRGSCQTGDCGGALSCTLSGQPPLTLSEFTLNGGNNLDYINLSVIDGFNVPMQFSSTSNGCNVVLNCRESSCPDAYQNPNQNEKVHSCPGGNLHALMLIKIPIKMKKFIHAPVAARFDIVNRCPYTVWPAAIPKGGGRQLNSGQTWPLDIPAGTSAARIWGRTGCSFDASGRGSCQTGDCGGALSCSLSGKSPTTLAEFSLNAGNNKDYIDFLFPMLGICAP
ncbi:hypothetical protein TSUD_77430 [Trifolium subterraneum]|uniref:Thaumatin-like protein n=1 Tax=Trifolium subterraneum TaxID=3900 RepID=A0A2Z6MAW5_TRISU|nr:hypothetical protein TSUD_77430 [Trifolium subterraneum]